MNKNVDIQNDNASEKEQKKSFLSGLVEIERDPKKTSTPQEPSVEVKDADTGQTFETVNSEIKTKKKKKKVKEEKKKNDNGLTEEEKLLVNTGDGVNLIPKKSEAEITKEKKKFSFSISSMISLLILILLSLGVVLFNIISKRQLNNAKESLYNKEIELESYTDKMISNEEILDRIDLYREIQEGVFSPKEIVQYILGVVDRSGSVTVRTFDLGDDLSFEMDGSTTDLSVVARLWYLLGTDDNIITINLNSVGKGDTGVSFSFQGELNADKFVGN
jgi:hypothetical protein